MAVSYTQLDVYKRQNVECVNGTDLSADSPFKDIVMAMSECCLLYTSTNKTICLDLGADAWIAAPFRLEECLSVANALIRRYTELNIGGQNHHVIFRNGLTLSLIHI